MGTSGKRFLLKLSGEVLKGDHPSGISPDICSSLSFSIKSLSETGCQLGIVIGGGNFFRGAEHPNLDRTPADQIGMLATIMNGLALKQALEKAGCETRVLSALECPRAVESYTWDRAIDYLNRGHVVIFVGGTGHPFFTTDTAAALRAAEIGASSLLKATKVDGVYSSDPARYPDAVRYDEVSYGKVLEENLGVMDGTAFALCRREKLPILVFHMDLLLKGEPVTIRQLEENGSLVH